MSPTGSAAVFTGYVYSPAQASQAEARIYRLNQTSPVDIVYLHAQAPGGTMDDRFVEILEQKRALISQVIDRREHIDDTQIHYSTGDLVFMITGKRDEKLDKLETDKKAVADLEQKRKDHAKATLYKRKYKSNPDVFSDDGSIATSLELDSEQDVQVQKVLDEESVTWGGHDEESRE